MKCEQHLRQIRGVAMGTKMGPSFACLFMGHLEEKYFEQFDGAIPSLYKRFIDDCFGVSLTTEQKLMDFINFASSFHPDIKFIHEISKTSLPFLDIRVSINNDSNKLSTSIFYKPAIRQVGLQQPSG